VEKKTQKKKKEVEEEREEGLRWLMVLLAAMEVAGHSC
jgi:hypothetical protein